MIYEIGDYCKLKTKVKFNKQDNLNINVTHYYKIIDILETKIHVSSYTYYNKYIVRDLETGEEITVNENRLYGDPDKLKKRIRLAKIKKLI